MPNLSRQRAALILVVMIAGCYALFMLATVFFYEKTQLAKNARSTISLLSDSLISDLNEGNYRKYLETLSNRKTEFGITKNVILRNRIDNMLISSQFEPEKFVCDGKEFEFESDNLLVCLYPNSSIAVQFSIELSRFILLKNPLFLTLGIANLLFAGAFIFFFIYVLKIYLDGLLTYLIGLSFGEENNRLMVPEDFQLVSQPILSLLKKVRDLNSQVEDQAKLNTLIDVSRQVAHDIRSPLSALTIAVKSLDEKGPAKDLIVNASKRIEQIASDLLTKAKIPTTKDNFDGKRHSQKLDLNAAVSEIVAEKVLIFSNIKTDISPSAIDADICGSKLEITRILSNIMNNAIEAVQEKSGGVVSVYVRYYPDFAQVIIIDNGNGIETNDLIRIGEKGLTIGKVDGSGLGIYHAKKYLESIDGKLSITSQVGEGTCVTLTIPLNK